MLQKLTELILMALFFGSCLWANASAAADLPPAEIEVQTTINPLLTFQVWKTQKINIAQEALTALKKDPKSPKAPGELARQMEYNLEVAHGLTVSDYFALYMKKKSPEEILALTKTLSPEEVATLLMGYKKLTETPQVAPSTAPRPESPAAPPETAKVSESTAKK